MGNCRGDLVRLKLCPHLRRRFSTEETFRVRCGKESVPCQSPRQHHSQPQVRSGAPADRLRAGRDGEPDGTLDLTGCMGSLSLTDNRVASSG